MKKHDVTVFRPYTFKVGQKIHIDDGPRKGDWEVLEIGDRKVRLRCPVSSREFEWDHFCYFIENRSDVSWPQNDLSAGN